MSSPELPLSGQYVIVTGGSRGIGLAAVHGLMQSGAHVVMAARDLNTSLSACKELSAQGLPGHVTCSVLDLEDLDSVRTFARAQQAALGKRTLSILVNNAGVMGVANAADGHDRHLQCNHVGPFLLTKLLEPNLAAGSRVVNVASRAHSMGALRFDDKGDLQGASWWWPAYCNSKLANVVLTAEQQRRWGPRGITCVSVSPGFVASSIFTGLPWPLNAVASRIASFVGRTTAQGAETVIFAATSPTITGTPEQLLLHDCKPYAPVSAARDPQLAKLLWDWSERIVNQK